METDFKEITEEVKVRKTYFYPYSEASKDLEKTDCVELDVYGHNTHLAKAQLLSFIEELQKILNDL